jgi:hypothetical protein
LFNGRRVISAVICGLIVTVSAHAEMMSVYKPDTERVQPRSIYNRFDNHNQNSSGYNNFTYSADPDSWSVEFLPQANTDVEQAPEVQQPQILTDGTNSFNLCLSALIGLGLCSSVNFVKRFSFNFVPEWYHNGGPFQIGHSYAITPESLCSAPDYCFVQPVCTVENSFTQYRLRTVVSIWRKSQFTPAVIASRGPPLMS